MSKSAGPGNFFDTMFNFSSCLQTDYPEKPRTTILSIGFDDQTKLTLHVVLNWKKGRSVRFTTCCSQLVKILLEFILCDRTVKFGCCKRKKLDSNFIHIQTSLSAKTPPSFRQQCSHLKLQFQVKVSKSIFKQN